MNAQQLLNFIDTDDLTYEATSLTAWEVGAVDNIDDVARYMWRGGPVPPQASANRPRRFLLSEEDHRPEKKYWDLVKREMFEFLCERSEKYESLWERIGELEKKSSHVLVVVISGYIGEKSGVEASMLAGFVAVCLYGLAKISKEAYCEHLNLRSDNA